MRYNNFFFEYPVGNYYGGVSYPYYSYLDSSYSPYSYDWPRFDDYDPYYDPWVIANEIMVANSQRRELLDLINKERQRNNLVLLQKDERLVALADAKATDMSKYNHYDHHSPRLGTEWDQLARAGIVYRRATANIDRGSSRGRDIFNDWMNSPIHRANMLDPAIRKIGLYQATSSSGLTYWSMIATS